MTIVSIYSPPLYQLSYGEPYTLKTKTVSNYFGLDNSFMLNLSHHIISEVSKWMLSSVVEHGIADPAVTGSNPVVSCFLVGVVGNISACHADARGSIPRLGVFLYVTTKNYIADYVTR